MASSSAMTTVFDNDAWLLVRHSTPEVVRPPGRCRQTTSLPSSSSCERSSSLTSGRAPSRLRRIDRGVAFGLPPLPVGKWRLGDERSTRASSAVSASAASCCSADLELAPGADEPGVDIEETPLDALALVPAK